jgi:peptide/nickel transport system permease protein
VAIEATPSRAITARRTHDILGVGRTWLRLVLTFASTLFGLLALTFFIGRMMPIDPVLAIIGDGADQETYDMVFKKLGLDQPVYVQFWIYVRDLVSGDFGVALLTGRPVLQDLMRVFPATIELATASIVIGAGIGVPLGVLAAANRNGPFDHLVRLFTLIGYSTPVFWLAMVGLLVFYASLGWVGGSGRFEVYYEGILRPVTGFTLIDAALAGEWDIFRSALRHLVLPASVLGYHSMAYITRMTRSFMLEQLSQEFIVTARLKGLSRTRVLWKHAFLNTRVQLVTIIALAYGGLLEGAVLVETVFAWPGFGQYLTNNLLIGDMNASMTCVLLVGVIFVVLNLISDILYRVFDPRTRQ